MLIITVKIDFMGVTLISIEDDNSQNDLNDPDIELTDATTNPSDDELLKRIDILEKQVRGSFPSIVKQMQSYMKLVHKQIKGTSNLLQNMLERISLLEDTSVEDAFILSYDTKKKAE